MCKSSATGPTIDCSGGAGCAPGMWSNTYDDPRKVNIRNIKLKDICDTDSECSSKVSGATCQEDNVADNVGFCVDNASDLSSVGFFSLNHIYVCNNPNATYNGQSACKFEPMIYVRDYSNACTGGGLNLMMCEVSGKPKGMMFIINKPIYLVP